LTDEAVFLTDENLFGFLDLPTPPIRKLLVEIYMYLMSRYLKFNKSDKVRGTEGVHRHMQRPCVNSIALMPLMRFNKITPCQKIIFCTSRRQIMKKNTRGSPPHRDTL
jgi:hypothetical protein